MSTLADNSCRLLARSTRKHARTLFSIPFRLHYIDIRGIRPVHAISLDISEGGVGALVQGRVRVGEAVHIELPLGDQSLSTLAAVRYTSEFRSGFEFLGLSQADREHISRFVAQT